jgi:molecular chaperone GrpE
LKKKEHDHKTETAPKTDTSEKVAVVDELQEAKNKMLRALADLDNFKKVMNKEREELVKFSNEALIRAILPVYDGFERALATMISKKELEETGKGLALVKRQLEDTLASFGVTVLDASNKSYDPNTMEAILQKESEGPENLVLEQMQKGFILHGRVIRPAMVIISKK